MISLIFINEGRRVWKGREEGRSEEKIKEDVKLEFDWRRGTRSKFK